MEDPEPYLACPHCLTEITQEDLSTAETKLGLDAGTQKTARDGSEGEKAKLQPTKTLCTHHFGFLSERSSKEKIPEECMACTEIVNCMLKAVKSAPDN